jgi:two-component system alkaline phosphatase synthesis response regulator PhoP
MMPDLDGIETCRVIRETPDLKDVLIAFLTARNEDYSQIAGFDAGADDYINKPIKPRVLVSRVKALLRRAGKTSASEDVLQVNGFTIDRERYLILKENQEKQVSVLMLTYELLKEVKNVNSTRSVKK